MIVFGLILITFFGLIYLLRGEGENYGSTKNTWK